MQRREFMAGAGAGMLLLACAAEPGGALTPEDFGARGDGRTNDTDAFAALSAYVNGRGGGTVVLRPVTYIVGKHLPPTGGPRAFAFTPSPILHFTGCRAPVVVRGNGAVLRAEGGLRFGSFDPRSGRAVERGSNFFDRSFRASPYMAMIYAEQCSGGVDIRDIELDGNLAALAIGGHWGDLGWQVPGTGLRLADNSGPEIVQRVHSHDHPQDGMMIDGPSQRVASSIIADVICEYNVRQGCSIVGGRNYSFERCRFRHTGKAGMRSAPSAGVDIEAGKKTIRSLRFSGCEFSDNSGPGMVAGTGDSADAIFVSCTFIGTTRWSVWPNKPGFRFSNCLFVGSLVHAYGDADPNRAAQFETCRFRDDPALSPTGEVFGSSDKGQPVIRLAKSPNVRFAGCDFSLTGGALLPWTTNDVIYSSCSMSQRSSQLSHPRGTYLGTNRIDGNADVRGSIVEGTLVLNGRRVESDA